LLDRRAAHIRRGRATLHQVEIRGHLVDLPAGGVDRELLVGQREIEVRDIGADESAARERKANYQTEPYT
jgi:hypothetical protein